MNNIETRDTENILYCLVAVVIREILLDLLELSNGLTQKSRLVIPQTMEVKF